MNGGTSDAVAQLSQAARWRLLGALLERPREGWAQEIHDLASELNDATLVALVRRASRSTEGAYLRLFGPGGAVSPREVAYRGTQDPGHVLADLQGLYDAFGFRPRVEDPADHLAVEASFAGMLCLKRAFAILGGSRRHADAAALGLRHLVERHLAEFAPQMASRLDRADGGYLASVARLIADRCPPPASRGTTRLPGMIDESPPCGPCGLAS